MYLCSERPQKTSEKGNSNGKFKLFDKIIVKKKSSEELNCPLDIIPIFPAVVEMSNESRDIWICSVTSNYMSALREVSSHAFEI